MLRRGFKSQCERRAIELRRQLCLADVAPLPALALAKAYDIEVWPLERVAGATERGTVDPREFGRDDWLLFTLRLGRRDLIVVNTRQSPLQQNSIVVHELAHIILGHELASTVGTAAGLLSVGSYDQDQEDEAAWFGSALLLPRPALAWMRRRRLSQAAASAHFGITPDLLVWRLQAAGVETKPRPVLRSAA
ncbi:MAG: ImmA/IrrE family metallo-endopeptidase [Stellaceae bacterium]